MHDSVGTTWWVKGGGWLEGQLGPQDRSATVNGFGSSHYPAKQAGGPHWRNLADPLWGRAVLRLDPDELRKDVNLLPSGAALWFQNEKGLGLAGLYDALLGRDRNAFIAIETRFRSLFPTAAGLRLDNSSNATKALGLTLVGGKKVSAAEMSEGMLYWLAFAIIEHLAPQSMLFIEEPENGLHPARIAEVMRVLHEVSQRTQIILATHSPLVINELRPEEVTIVTRTAEDGTRCKPMIETKHFETRKQVYALGELWLSFADGDEERDLVTGGEVDSKAG